MNLPPSSDLDEPLELDSQQNRDLREKDEFAEGFLEGTHLVTVLCFCCVKTPDEDRLRKGRFA